MIISLFYCSTVNKTVHKIVEIKYLMYDFQNLMSPYNNLLFIQTVTTRDRPADYE